MTDLTDHRIDASPNQAGKVILLQSGTTVTGGTDTLTLDLTKVGIKNVLAFQGFVHTTDHSVLVKESGTSAVASGIFTYTTAAGNNNKRRTVIVYGES